MMGKFRHMSHFKNPFKHMQSLKPFKNVFLHTIYFSLKVYGSKEVRWEHPHRHARKHWRWNLAGYQGRKKYVGPIELRLVGEEIPPPTSVKIPWHGLHFKNTYTHMHIPFHGGAGEAGRGIHRWPSLVPWKGFRTPMIVVIRDFKTSSEKPEARFPACRWFN